MYQINFYLRTLSISRIQNILFELLIIQIGRAWGKLWLMSGHATWLLIFFFTQRSISHVLMYKMYVVSNIKIDCFEISVRNHYPTFVFSLGGFPGIEKYLQIFLLVG